MGSNQNMNGAYLNSSVIPEDHAVSGPLQHAHSAGEHTGSEGEERPLTANNVPVSHTSIDIEANKSGDLTGEGSPAPAKEKPVGRSSVNVASIIRRDSNRRRDSTGLRMTPSGRSRMLTMGNLERYCSTGRVYHPEHLHGHRTYADQRQQNPIYDPFGAPSMQQGGFPDDDGKGSMRFEPPTPDRGGGPRRTSTLGDGGLNTAASWAGGNPPMPPAPSGNDVMPKWPANWTSAAFEAVSKKKAMVLSPPEIYAEIAHHGHEKSKWSWYKILMLSILAGCYVGFGYTTVMIVGGQMTQAPTNPDHDEVNKGVHLFLVGAFGFPFAFTIIVSCGAELYTSMCAYTAAAWWEGQLKFIDGLRMLFISFFGNFIGTAIMNGMFIAANTYDSELATAYVIYTGEKKTSDSWGATFAKAILANWLVGIATWMANAALDMTGKFVGIWLPISAFAAMGFEHVVANMFIIPMAISQGANIDARHFVGYNLVPAAIGNWVGGAFFIATSYAMVYGRTPPRVYAFFEELWHKMVSKDTTPDTSSSTPDPLDQKAKLEVSKDS